jgi:hypothetical protein
MMVGFLVVDIVVVCSRSVGGMSEMGAGKSRSHVTAKQTQSACVADNRSDTSEDVFDVDSQLNKKQHMIRGNTFLKKGGAHTTYNPRWEALEFECNTIITAYYGSVEWLEGFDRCTLVA